MTEPAETTRETGAAAGPDGQSAGPILSVRNVVKTFGTVRAVDGVSFDVRRGTITGLLGRNGAGKTTTLRMITGIFLPDAGSYYSRSATDIMTQERLARVLSQGVWRERLVARGIEPSDTENLLARVAVESVQVSRSGRMRKGGELNFLAAFLFAALLLIPMFAYGQEMMRGIVQEKTDRVVEILISSMSPIQLLSGKILGLAAAALTQVAAWLLMAGAGAFFLAGAAASAGVNPRQFIEPRILPFFVIFFLLGYLTFSSFYAIAGAATNSDKEAQQFVTPVMLLIMFPWFLAMPVLQAPDSRLAVVLSLIPIFTPITMFLRLLASEPPAWQLALSITLSAATVYGLLWLTAKIFRVGILSYGKKPTIPELWRWMKVA